MPFSGGSSSLPPVTGMDMVTFSPPPEIRRRWKTNLLFYALSGDGRGSSFIPPSSSPYPLVSAPPTQRGGTFVVATIKKIGGSGPLLHYSSFSSFLNLYVHDRKTKVLEGSIFLFSSPLFELDLRRRGGIRAFSSSFSLSVL